MDFWFFAPLSSWRMPVVITFCFCFSLECLFLILALMKWFDFVSVFFIDVILLALVVKKMMVSTSLNVSCTPPDSPTGILPHVRGLGGVNSGDEDCDTDHYDGDDDLTCPG